MRDECVFWKFGYWMILVLFAVQSGVLIYMSYENNAGGDWDERTLTREAIQNYDYVLKYIDDGKYEEAYVLADATDTYLWYLRNSKRSRTDFYDEMRTHTIAWYIGLASEYNDSVMMRDTIIQIKIVQQKLCPKSDLSQAWWHENYPEYADDEEMRC